MRRTMILSLMASSLSLAALPASAATFVYGGVLTGGAENPPVASPGSGTTTITYDDLAHTLHVAVFFSGLTGLTTASHIHVAAAPGINGGVATTVPNFAGFPLGVSSGSYDKLLDLTSATSFNPAFVTANGGTAGGAEAALALGLAEGRSYLNVHSSFSPSGEIRANLVPVPEPLAWMMMVSGFAAIGMALRRKKHAAAL